MYLAASHHTLQHAMMCPRALTYKFFTALTNALLHISPTCLKVLPEVSARGEETEGGRDGGTERCNRIITQDTSLKGTAVGGPIWALHQQTHTSIATATRSQCCLIMADKDECISSQSTLCPILIQWVPNTPHALYLFPQKGSSGVIQIFLNLSAPPNSHLFCLFLLLSPVSVNHRYMSRWSSLKAVSCLVCSKWLQRRQEGLHVF